MRPRDAFDDPETVLEVLCRGCPQERGWLGLKGERGECCPNMVAIQDNAEGSVVRGAGGVPRCPRRKARDEERKSAEQALYERRMRGDWS
ncbi:MAG: hypothetical protein HFJ72_08505 [Adlercreutzia sp.]|nr:hypothetical protein [Adlercreutzia sp.]